MPLCITSVQNPRVKAAARLRDRQGREEQGRILIDGRREIRQALAAGVPMLEAFYLPEALADEHTASLLDALRAAGAELVEVAPHVHEKLAFGQRQEPIIAVARPQSRQLVELALPPDALVAVIEGVEKPGNLGAIVRTADAAGVAAVLVADGGTDLYNPNAIRASLGAIFALPVCAASTDRTLAWLRSHGFRLFAARVDGAVEYSRADLRGRVALVLGSEAHGLSKAWQTADITAVKLPMLGRVDSLNLSATAAVLFYEALRQRRG